MNQVEDKDDELVAQNFMLTIFRWIQMDLTWFFKKKKIGGKGTSYLSKSIQVMSGKNWVGNESQTSTYGVIG